MLLLCIFLLVPYVKDSLQQSRKYCRNFTKKLKLTNTKQQFIDFIEQVL